MGYLENNVAVVTGGGGVLCSEMARTLAHEGASVAVVDLNEETARQVASALRDEGYRAEGFAGDVLNKDALHEAKAKIEGHFGQPCNLLVNGAGGNHPKGTTSKEFLLEEHLNDEALTTFFDLDPKGIEFVFNLNFLGTLLPSQVFGQGMIGQQNASIINISSMNAFTPLTKIPAYSGAKASVSNFTQWLAVHFSKVGIRVNALAPGFFLTEQNRTLLTDEEGSLTARGKQIIDHTPLGRFGDPEDLSSTLLWLCNPASSFVTGVVVPIDGGFSAYSGV